MALSKCLYCNTEKDRKTMYKYSRPYSSVDKNTGEKVQKFKNEYYCNEECFSQYEKILQDRSNRKEIIDIICETLCVPFNTLMIKDLKEKIYEYYKPNVVLQYLQEEKDRLYKTMNNKSFSNLNNKISYLIAIIQNGLAKYTYKDYNEIIYGTYYEPVEITNHNNSNRNNRKKSLKDLEEEYVNEKEG